MTPEQELTAMIEGQLWRFMANWMLCNPGAWWDGSECLRLDIEAMAEMPEPDRQNAALRKLYWLATDPDDMVH